MSSWIVIGEGPLRVCSGHYSSSELRSLLIVELEIHGPEVLDNFLTGSREGGRGLYSGSQMLAAVGSELSE
jgi:hypothetical protein